MTVVRRNLYINGVIAAQELTNHEKSFLISGLLLLPTKAIADTHDQN